MGLSRVILFCFVLFLCVTYAKKSEEEQSKGHEKEGHEKEGSVVKGGHEKGSGNKKGGDDEKDGHKKSPVKGPVEGPPSDGGHKKGGHDQEGGHKKGGPGKTPVEGPPADEPVGGPVDKPPVDGPIGGPVDVPIKGGGSTVNVKQFGAKGDGSSLDNQAFLKAWKTVCSSSAKFPVLVIPNGNYLLSAIEFLGPCNAPAVGVQLLGNLISSPQKAHWSTCTDFISFRHINNLEVTGSGVIDGNGEQWWGNKLSCGKRPTNLALNNCNGVTLSGIQSKNSARNHMSVAGTTGATISGITLTAPGTSPNTDGIDISSSSSITIKNSVIGSGDDCIAINSMSKDINVNNVKCGPGHGISIGSLGRGGEVAQVENVIVSQCTFTKTDNGARIKTWKGGRGYVRNVIYRDITLDDVRHPIIIDQNYVDKHNPLANEDSSLSISDVKFINFKGTCQETDAITLACSNSGAGCTDVELVNVNIQGASGEKPQATCENASVRTMQSQPPVSCMQKAGTLDFKEYMALTETDYN